MAGYMIGWIHLISYVIAILVCLVATILGFIFSCDDFYNSMNKNQYRSKTDSDNDTCSTYKTSTILSNYEKQMINVCISS